VIPTSTTHAPRGPREWRLAADDDRLPQGPRTSRALAVAVLSLFVVACAVPLAVSFYLLAWPALHEPNSAIPGMLASLVVLVALVGAVACAVRVAAVVRGR
jgi:hypothetical protein